MIRVVNNEHPSIIPNLDEFDISNLDRLGPTEASRSNYQSRMKQRPRYEVMSKQNPYETILNENGHEAISKQNCLDAIPQQKRYEIISNPTH